jgi:uncharacterized protein YndB with AHSA1/START domain
MNGTIEVKAVRVIPAQPEEVFDAWLSAQVPGTVWHAAEKFIIDPRTDGLFYWRTSSQVPHYGRFTAVQRPARLEHTWISPNTQGRETEVTVTFERIDTGTRMTLTHTNLPDTEAGRGHDKGWNYFLGLFEETLIAKAA